MSQKPRAGGPPRAGSVARSPKPIEARPEADAPVEAGPAEAEEPAASMEPAIPEVGPLDAAPAEPAPTEPASETVIADSEAPAAAEEVITEAMPTQSIPPRDLSAEAERPAAHSTTPPLTQGMKTMLKTTEDLVAFNQANFEAFVKSGQIWTAGMQELAKQIASSAKASFDESVTTFKAVASAKSVKEAMDLQSTYAKAALEKAMVESNKITDASIKLTEETLAPITARVSVAVESFKVH